ncbi:uncharacterized protein [Euphorbia lathyris]|uniref:uncharacterized protein n=1 Tax=Euphorbia lathyris TaxID=212925 RepID=UPI003313C72C
MLLPSDWSQWSTTNLRATHSAYLCSCADMDPCQLITVSCFSACFKSRHYFDRGKELFVHFVNRQITAPNFCRVSLEEIMLVRPLGFYLKYTNLLVHLGGDCGSASRLHIQRAFALVLTWILAS